MRKASDLYATGALRPMGTEFEQSQVFRKAKRPTRRDPKGQPKSTMEIVDEKALCLLPEHEE